MISLGVDVRGVEEIPPAVEQLSEDAFALYADEVFVQYRNGWPFETGLSRGSLRLDVDGTDGVIRSHVDYAFYVEARWYPFPGDVDVDAIARMVSNA